MCSNLVSIRRVDCQNRLTITTGCSWHYTRSYHTIPVTCCFCHCDRSGSTKGRILTISFHIVKIIADKRLGYNLLLWKNIIHGLGRRACGVKGSILAMKIQDYVKCYWSDDILNRSIYCNPSRTICYLCCSELKIVVLLIDIIYFVISFRHVYFFVVKFIFEYIIIILHIRACIRIECRTISILIVDPPFWYSVKNIIKIWHACWNKLKQGAWIIPWSYYINS